jgi:urea transport system ATP-binding protein
MKTKSVLSCKKVTVSFNGFKAVDGMDLELAAGELRFLIGPNGAGKTTMLDAICGKVRPSSGSILFQGKNGTIEVTKRREHELAQLGIGRKFQTPSIFAGLTVSENLEIAMSQRRGVFSTIKAVMKQEERERIDAELALIGLGDKRHWRAGGLSHGEKQWLEIGMMLLQEPEILLLDEPVAGMTDKETEKTGMLLQEIVRKRTVIVVEHDMEFVRNFASKVTVMHEGRLLKEGTMNEVQNDERVAEVYLGKRRDYHAVGSTA